MQTSVAGICRAIAQPMIVCECRSGTDVNSLPVPPWPCCSASTSKTRRLASRWPGFIAFTDGVQGSSGFGAVHFRRHPDWKKTVVVGDLNQGATVAGERKTGDSRLNAMQSSLAHWHFRRCVTRQIFAKTHIRSEGAKCCAQYCCCLQSARRRCSEQRCGRPI